MDRHLTVGNQGFLLTHDISTLPKETDWASVQIIISGPSHKPAITEHNGCILVNPGSAGLDGSLSPSHWPASTSTHSDRSPT